MQENFESDAFMVRVGSLRLKVIWAYKSQDLLWDMCSS